MRAQPNTTEERGTRSKVLKVERDTCTRSRSYTLGVTTKEACWEKVSDAQLHRRGRGGDLKDVIYLGLIAC